MAYRNNILKKYYTSVATFVSDLLSELSAMGWTLEDNQSSSNYVVYSSTNPNGVKGYLKISWSSTSLNTTAYTYWNSTTHTGYGAQSNVPSLTFSESGTYIWIYGSDQFFYVMSLIGSSYYHIFGGHLIPDINIYTYLTASASSGSNVQIAVNSTAGFVAGKKYQIVDFLANGYRQWVQIASINDDTHMTIASLGNNYPAGAIIGTAPIIFGTYLHNNAWLLPTTPLGMTGNGIVNSSDYYLSLFQLIPKAYMNPNNRSPLQLRGLQPVYFGSSDSTYSSLAGYRDDFIFQPPTGSPEDVYMYTENLDYRDSGTSSGSNTSTTLNDNTKNWTANAWQNKVVVITAGTGVGQIRKIVSNTSNQLTVANDWVTIPDSTSQYKIVDEAYRVGAGGYFALREGY
ncbi:MAG: hypothetical protein ACP5HC_06310 [Caldisericum sp.]